jgi:hypothetical protein
VQFSNPAIYDTRSFFASAEAPPQFPPENIRRATRHRTPGSHVDPFLEIEPSSRFDLEQLFTDMVNYAGRAIARAERAF